MRKHLKVLTVLILIMILSLVGCKRNATEEDFVVTNSTELNKDVEQESIPKLPEMDNIVAAFESVLDWAGVYVFANVDPELPEPVTELTDEVRAVMAIRSAEHGLEENMGEIPVYELTDSFGHELTREQVDTASKNLFGKSIDEFLQEENKDDNLWFIENNNFIIKIGDWGLVQPFVEITDLTNPNRDGLFTVRASFYAFNYELGKEDEDFNKFNCGFACEVNDESKHGFIIKNMTADITEGKRVLEARYTDEELIQMAIEYCKRHHTVYGELEAIIYDSDNEKDARIEIRYSPTYDGGPSSRHADYTIDKRTGKGKVADSDLNFDDFIDGNLGIDIDLNE